MRVPAVAVVPIVAGKFTTWNYWNNWNLRQKRSFTIYNLVQEEPKRTYCSRFYVEAIRYAIVMSTLSRLSNELCHSIQLPAYSVASAVNPVFSWLRQSRSRIFAVNVVFGRRKNFW